MKKRLVKYLSLAICFCMLAGVVDAQKKVIRNKSTRKVAKGKTTATVKPTVAVVDSIKPVVVAPLPIPVNDSLPLKKVLKSLRPDEAVTGGDDNRDRTPLGYENLRIDDAMFRHKIWREIDTREKINLPFRYSADENNGNQRFISILLQAIQDSVVTVFSNIDDRFTTPMTKSDVAKAIGGEPIPVKQYDSLGNEIGVVMKAREINLDSIYKFHIKEEVIFDKESSRLFWRILGIAPVMNVINSQGINLGESEVFWVYYPDMRPVFARYEVYNGKNFGARMTWEELFESRMFYGRIIKSTIDNPYDIALKNYPGVKENTMFQLMEGENIKEKIFNYEQDLWSY
ncbi:MAG: gliding motility protein GldN [Sphingobacteriales bacterium]|nr:gliding motility protein GldN [Sphingobacteriales bacterium]